MPWLTIPSPVGDLVAVARDGALCWLEFADSTRAGSAPGGTPDGAPDPGDPVLAATARQLEAYFAGELTDFELPLSLAGSPFERAVWAQLTCIPYAQTASYGDIARAVTDDVGASRAVGIANNHNPVPIIVPCHRVVGANRKLVGYGGGLHRKRFLLELEARVEFTASGLLPS